MKILITGSNGFIGKNLKAELQNRGYNEILDWNKTTTEKEIDTYTRNCDFVIHLAGENRPKDIKYFEVVNVGLTQNLIKKLKANNTKCPIIFASSIQATLDNEYGRTKKKAEEIIQKYGKENNINTYIYRLPNVFGKWCKPNYNSVIATFCNNIARGLPVKLNNKDVVLELAYIDDVVSEFIDVMQEDTSINCKEIKYINNTYKEKLENILRMIESFRNVREKLILPNVKDEFIKKLYSTYLSYLPPEDFKYKLNSNTDERGSFTEILKTKENGQISVNIIKPNCIKGNHWHHTKIEKFIVLRGEGIIKMENISTKEVINIVLNDKELNVVDIPVGYIHSIINNGSQDLVMLIWANEIFNKEKPDTFYPIGDFSKNPIG